MKFKEFICNNCGKSFYKYPCQVRDKSIFCSRKCYDSVKSLRMSGKNNPMYGKRFFGEENPHWQGGKTKLLQQIRNSQKYLNWKIAIFRRDNQTCQNCGFKGYRGIISHHIISLSKIIKENNIKNIFEAFDCLKVWDINNGITLCNKCHKKTDNFSWKENLKRINFKITTKQIKYNNNSLLMNLPSKIAEKIGLLSRKGQLQVCIEP